MRYDLAHRLEEDERAVRAFLKNTLITSGVLLGSFLMLFAIAAGILLLR